MKLRVCDIDGKKELPRSDASPVVWNAGGKGVAMTAARKRGKRQRAAIGVVEHTIESLARLSSGERTELS